MISLKDCVHGHIYKGTGRNFDIGWYNSENKCFTGVREKWGDNFLFEEVHYEVGAPHGTFKPEEEIYGYFDGAVRPGEPEHYHYLFAKLKQLNGDTLDNNEKILLAEYAFLHSGYSTWFEELKEVVSEYTSEECLIDLIAAAKLKLEGKI